jgi:DNA-binding MarR family transcriptional regulator
MEETIGTVLAHVARLLRRNFEVRVRDIGVTRPQWQVLSLLSFNQGINQGGLAELLEVEPITLGRMVDRLQESELVERRADPADRRAWRLFLTSKGGEVLDRLRPFVDETYEIALEGVSDDQRTIMITTLDRMRTNLSRRPPPLASDSDG